MDPNCIDDIHDIHDIQIFFSSALIKYLVLLVFSLNSSTSFFSKRQKQSSRGVLYRPATLSKKKLQRRCFK